MLFMCKIQNLFNVNVTMATIGIYQLSQNINVCVLTIDFHEEIFILWPLLYFMSNIFYFINQVFKGSLDAMERHRQNFLLSLWCLC